MQHLSAPSSGYILLSQSSLLHGQELAVRFLFVCLQFLSQIYICLFSTDLIFIHAWLGVFTVKTKLPFILMALKRSLNFTYSISTNFHFSHQKSKPTKKIHPHLYATLQTT